MQELNSIIAEQARWLQMRGFDEKGLNNEEAEGMYKIHLRDALQQVIDNSDIILLDKEPFKVHAFGLFDENKDKVLFTFHYDFDSFERRLSLKEVDATLNQVELNLQIETMDDLWHSKDLYLRVKQLSRPIVNAVKERRKENLQKLADTTANHLKNLEYEKYSEKSEGWIARRLMVILNKAENKPDSIYYFNLHTTLRNGTAIDPVHTSIHFEYIPKSQHLTLKSLCARLGECKEIIFQTSRQSIPNAREVIDLILRRQTLEKANKINQVQQNCTKTQRKRI